MKKFVKITAITLTILLVVVAASGIITYFSLINEAQFDSELLPSTKYGSVVTTSSGVEIDKSLKSQQITADNLPKNLVNAFVALEDKRFYKHNGIDYYRIGGAIISNLKSKSYAEGASTISQQLIKNTHLSQEKTIKRKLKEHKLALKLEKQYSKDEIMAMYLNMAYFGDGLYGVSEAARRFFDKNPEELSLSQCATLAAVVKRPKNYSPLQNIEKSEERRNLVLSLMQSQGYISEADKDSSQKEITVLVEPKISVSKAYVASALAEASSILSVSVASVRASGLTIETYLDESLQKNAASLMQNQNLYKLNENGNSPTKACMIADNQTKGILAYYCDKPNSVFEIKRQAGSVIKPLLVYAPSFEEGLLCPASPILDEKTDFNGYAPSNFKNQYFGWTDIRNSLIYSLNAPAVKSLSLLGAEKAFSYADKMNIKLNEADKNLNLALGGLTDGVTFTELLGGYMTLASNGSYSRPTFIKRIIKDNRIVYENRNEQNKVFSEETAYLITDILLDTAEIGTAKGLKTHDYQIASKTGTVAFNGVNRDAFNLSYTTKHTVLVWHGNFSGEEAFNLADSETGGAYTTKCTKQIYDRLYQFARPDNFIKPIGVISQNYDLVALKQQNILKLAVADTPDGYYLSDLFNQKFALTETADTFTNLTTEYTISYNGKTVEISFIAKPYLGYEIYKNTPFNSILIDNVSNFDGEFRNYYDTDVLDFFSNYSVKTYYINNFGEKVYENKNTESYPKSDNYRYQYYKN